MSSPILGYSDTGLIYSWLAALAQPQSDALNRYVYAVKRFLRDGRHVETWSVVVIVEWGSLWSLTRSVKTDN